MVAHGSWQASRRLTGATILSVINLYRDRPDLYDLLHNEETTDLLFYAGFAGAMVPAGGAVLELGCGTGRVMEALLERDVQVTGIEAEPAMLERAHSRLARFGARSRLVHGDMRRLELGDERFDLIIVSVNTFMHLDDHAAQRACLSGVQGHLRDTGCAILDVANPFHTLALPQGILTIRRQAHAADTGREVTVTGALEVDPTAQRLVDHLFFDEAGPDGALHRLSAQLELRVVFMPELELLLAASGLGIADAYGDYDLGSYNPTSERMIAVVRPLD